MMTLMKVPADKRVSENEICMPTLNTLKRRKMKLGMMMMLKLIVLGRLHGLIKGGS